MTPDEYRAIQKEESRRQSIRAVVVVAALVLFAVLLVVGKGISKHL